MYFLSNQQEDHYFDANSRQFQTGRPVVIEYLDSQTQAIQLRKSATFFGFLILVHA